MMATLRWEGTCKAELTGDSEDRLEREEGKGNIPDDAVCALADDVEDLVVAADDEGGHAVVHGG